MKFKVGDKVKVKESLKAGEIYGRYFNEEMARMCGRTVTIAHVDYSYYNIKELKCFYWTDEMFEEIEPENKFKVGQKVSIKRTGRIGRIIKINNPDFSDCGSSKLCYLVAFGNEADWFTVHDLEEVKEILDDVERKYLSDVIRPFKRNVINIKKIETYRGEQFIKIRINSVNRILKTECIELPLFKKDTMYKKMKENKEYNLKELNLED